MKLEKMTRTSARLENPNPNYSDSVLRTYLITVSKIRINSESVKACDDGEEFKSCSSPCEPKCSDNGNTGCIDMCDKPRCQCKQGYARDENKKCIPREKCPKNGTTCAPDYGCKEGEVFKSCASACEPTCKDTGDIACTLQCLPGKCQCKEGYVRDENNTCIPKEKCPNLPNPYPQFCCNPFHPCWRCPVGQHCVGEPGARRCVPTVCNLACRIGYECKIIDGKPTCVPSQNGCSLIKCRSGYECKIIDGKPQCVPIACNLACRIGYECKIIDGKPQCVPKCSKGEEYKDCPTGCELICGQKPRFCPAVCLKPPRCQCSLGYARTSEGICIPRNECPISENATTEVPPSTTPLICVEGEVAGICPCEATCARKHPICPLLCRPGKQCMCKRGFARVAKGKCIPIEQCPEEPTTQKPCILPCPLAFLCKFVNGEATCVRAKDCSKINCGIAYTCKVIDGEATCVPLYGKSTTETYGNFIV